MTSTLYIIVKINNITNSKSITFQKLKNKKTAKLGSGLAVDSVSPFKEKITIRYYYRTIFVNPPRTGGSWRQGFARSVSPDSGTRQSEPCRERRGQAEWCIYREDGFPCCDGRE